MSLKTQPNPGRSNRPQSVGPPGLIFSALLIFLTHAVEQFFNMKTYSLSSPWFYTLFVLVLAEAALIIVWAFLSLLCGFGVVFH